MCKEECENRRSAVEKKQTYCGLTYEETVRKYADTVTRICMLRCGNAEDARDCFQNVFMKLLSQEDIFNSEEHLKAWLIRVAVNQCTDIYRQFWKRSVDLKGESYQLEFAATGVTDSEDLDVIGHVMELPVKYREVIYMHYYEGYQVSEISKILNQKESTVKSLMRRGREKLRIELGGDWDEAAVRV